MENRERICRFCFEKCDIHFKAIDRSTRVILNTLLVTANLAISDEPVICENCSRVLQKSFIFKNICLNIKDNTVAFSGDENNDHAVCEFCMSLLKDGSFTILDNEEDISGKTMLKKYFPELMDLTASKKPVICEICHESLVVFLTFVTIISIVEEKIKEYCEEKGLHNTDLIKLNDVLQFMSENAWKENDNKLEVFEDMISVKNENEKMEEGTCTLCLEKRGSSKVVDENTKNLLDIILLKLDFTGVQEVVMCENCEEVLKKCFDFKTTSLQTHSDYIVPFVNEDDVQLNLKDVYLNKNVTCTGVPEGQDICALCMGLVNNCSAISLDVEEGDMLERMIEECLPELDLSIIKEPVICVPCHGSLENCFHFVKNCLIVWEQIKKYCETPDINSESQIELSNSLRFPTRDIKREVDGNSTNKIKVGDQFCEDSEDLHEKKVGDGPSRVKLEETFLDDSGDANNDIVTKYESFMEINDHEVNEQKYTPKNMLAHAEESNKLGSIKIEDTVCGENETSLKEEDSVEMEDQKFLLNEEIEIKTDEHDFTRYEDSIILPQSEVARRLHTREKCSVLNLEKDQSKSGIEHILTNKQISKIKMCQRELCSFQTKHKRCRVNRNLILESFKKRLLAHKDPTEITMHTCDFCSFKTGNKYYIKIHLLMHKDPSEVTMHKCNFCCYQTKVKSRLKSHLLKHKDPSEVTMYKCDCCLYQTKFKASLKSHLLKHKNPSEVTMYKCDFCSFQTKFKSSLKNHLLTHKDPSDVTMYKCDSCLYESKFKTGLKSHLLKHKDPSEVTMYKCDFCSFQTKVKGSVKRHELTHKIFQK